MIGAVARKLFGSSNDRRIRTYRPRVDAINALEKELEQLSDEALRARTEEFKKQLADGATARRHPGPRFRHRARGRQAHARPAPFRRPADRRHGAARRQDRRDEDRRRQDAGRHAAGLSQRAAGRGVHVVTVNDYLAKRDAEWMGQIYKFLGLTVGVIVHGLDDDRAQEGNTTATSPTAPTTSSASTICATT